MQSLIDFPLLKLPNDLHVLLANGVLLEIVELGGVVGEIEEVDFALVFIIELFDVLSHVQIVSASPNEYFDSLTILSAIYFLEWEAVHLSISFCLISMVFS